MRITRKQDGRPRWKAPFAVVVLAGGTALAVIPGGPASATPAASSSSYSVTATGQPQAEGAAGVTAQIDTTAQPQAADVAASTMLYPRAITLTAVAIKGLPKIPRSSESCNANWPSSKAGQNVCIHVVGHSNYLQWIQVGVGMHALWTVSGYFRVYTVYRASNGFNFKTKMLYCHSGPGAIYICWLNVRYVFNKWLGIPGENGRTPHQEICAKFYHANGTSQGGPACENIYR